MSIVYNVIHWIIQLFVLVVIIQAVLSYFADPYQPVRRTIDEIVNPFLNPIRRVVPPLGNLDLSPLVLIILLQVLDSILYRVL